MLDFIFFNILYPLFQEQIDALIDKHRLAQVRAIEMKDGLVKVTVTKAYAVGSQLVFYEPYPDGALYEEEPPYQYIGHLENVYGYGEVIEQHTELSTSIVLMTKINKIPELGILAKSMNSMETALSSLKERKWTK